MTIMIYIHTFICIIKFDFLDKSLNSIFMKLPVNERVYYMDNFIK